MTIGIVPHSASPPSGEKQQATFQSVSGDGRTSASRSAHRGSADPTVHEAATVRRATNNQISYDTPTGLMIVRTVDLKSGEVVGQNPTEAYLRLAHAMTEAIRADRGDHDATRPANTDVVA